MNATSASFEERSSTTPSKIYREAFQQLYRTRRWGSRRLDEVCRRYNISTRNMLRTYCVLLVVRLSRFKVSRRPKAKKLEPLNSELLEYAREALLAASCSRYADRQQLDSLLNGTQAQTRLRQLARYVDEKVEEDSFLRAVCSLPHAQHVSDNVKKRIAFKLRSFYESSRFRSPENMETVFSPVTPLTEHLARYRLYATYWRHHLRLEDPSALYTDLRTSASELDLDGHAVDTGIRTIASAFETDDVTFKLGEHFQVFNTLLNGNASSLWSKFIAAKKNTDGSNSIGFASTGQDESVERIIEAGGLESMDAVREDPTKLLVASHISSDSFYRVVTTLSKEHSLYEQLRYLFEALCARTSAGDCRDIVRIVWKEGGFSWLRNALLSDISKKTNLTEDEARRIQASVRGYVHGLTRTTGHTSNL